MHLLCLLSPAKRLEYERPLPPFFFKHFSYSRPRFASDALLIAHGMRGYDVAGLRELMGVSVAIAERGYAQFQKFAGNDAYADANGNATSNGNGGFSPLLRAAMYAFSGDTYIGLNSYALDKDSVAHAHSKIRILSGLYGLLRPLDGIQPYRLEMGLNIYKGVAVFGDARRPADWWRDKVTLAIEEDIKSMGARYVLNLASKEYLGAVDCARLSVPLLDVVFAARSNGIERRLGMAEKRMRGAFARYVVENEIESLESLRDFSELGFSYSVSGSSARCLRFVK